MAHKEQIDFCLKVKELFPNHFRSCSVIDVGSLDINGNNRIFFSNCDYVGIDIGEGPNVDIISLGHKYLVDDESIDTIISTECFEHDIYFDLTLKNLVRILKRQGLLLFTCATTNRPVHGTRDTDVESSPLTSEILHWGNYYKNITENDIRRIIDIDSIFDKYEFEINFKHSDLYFYGIKK